MTAVSQRTATRALAGVAIGVAALIVSGPGFAAPHGSLEARLARLETQVQRLRDRADIRQLLLDYGQDLDKRDFSAYANLFAPNGDWTGYLGGTKVTVRGPRQIRATMEKAFAPSGKRTTAVRSFHILTNAIIHVHGDRATASSKWTFVLIRHRKAAIANAGRYEDVLVRQRGHWKFLHRVAPSIMLSAPK